MWTVIGPDLTNKRMTICRCSCGTEKRVWTGDLRSGASTMCRPCGHKTHGRSAEREYRIWYGVVARCTMPGNTAYTSYGATGITVCDRWANRETGYAAFLADMGPCPLGNSSIDRIDNQSGYYPENCKWATRHEQNVNRKSTVWVTVEGTKMCAKDAARKLGYNYTYFLIKIRKEQLQ